MDVTNYGAGGEGQGKEQLKAQELKDFYSLGKEFRDTYVKGQGLVGEKYDSQSVFLHADSQTTSMISAYAFILGAYPDNVSYLDASSATLLTAEQLARTSLGLSKTPSSQQNSKVQISSDDGYLYWRQPTKHCPILYSRDQLMASVKSTSGATSTDRLRRISNKIQLDGHNTVKKLLEDFPGFDKNSFKDQYENLDHFSYNLGASNSNDLKADSVKHSHFFIDQTAFVSLLRSFGYKQADSSKTADNVRFEIFETNGKYYARTNLGAQAINFEGAQNGVFDLNTFLTLVYSRLYITGVQDV